MKYTLSILLLFGAISSTAQAYYYSFGMHLNLYYKKNNTLVDANNLEWNKDSLAEVYYKITFVNASDTIISVDSFPQMVSEYEKEGFHFVAIDSGIIYESKNKMPLPICWPNQQIPIQFDPKHGKKILLPNEFYTMPYVMRTNFFSNLPKSAWVTLRCRLKLPNGKGYYMQESDNTVFINLH